MTRPTPPYRAEPTLRCERCGEPIHKTNWALGPGWNHEHGDSRCYMGHAVGPRYWEKPVIERPSYIYVASSWRNPMQPAVIHTLRAAGLDCYDFRNPEGGTGFSWKQVKPNSTPGVAGKGSDWETVEDYLAMVHHPIADLGFAADFDAMKRADTFVLVLPCGKSAHLELGWAVGAGKRTAILLEDPCEPELMYRMVDHLSPNLFDLLGWLGVED